MYVLYATHPQVTQDPAVPVPRWGLTEEGRARASAFARHPLVRDAHHLFASTETKAIELAEIIAAESGASITTDHRLHENDRSATGFVPPARFEELADAFFAHPDQSTGGWERALDAQARVIAAFHELIATRPDAPLVFCGHGAVGTLLKCHLAGRGISRSEDQRQLGNPGGNVWVMRRSDGTLISDWTPFERLSDDLPLAAR